MNDFNDKEELDELIYPINVTESLKSSGMKSGEKTSLVASFWCFGTAVLAWVLASWLRGLMPKYYLIITISIILLLQLTVGVYLLRILLDEKGLTSEMNSNDMLFTNYFNFYRELKTGDTSPYPFDVIEYSNGSHVVFIQCLLGYNTQERSIATYYINKEAEQILTKSGYPYRKIFSNEIFKGSKAAKQLAATMDNITEPTLFTVYRDIITNVMDMADKESNVMCVTYILHAHNRIQKDDLKGVVTRFVNTLSKPDSAFREVNILIYEDILEFLRRQYGLDVLDIGLIRTLQAVKKRINCAIKVLKIKGKSGKIYNTKELSKFYDSLKDWK